MNIKSTLLYPVAMAAVISSPLAWSEAVSKSGEFTGKVVRVDVNSTGNTTVMYRRPEQKAWDKHAPMPMGGKFTFSWPAADGNTVDFDGAIDLGTFSTDTHAKVAFMNIKSIQTFYDFVQNVKGTATWDPATRTLSYDMKPEGRDDGRASTVTQSKDATCDEADSRACKAFFKTSAPLEGLRMKLTFSEDLGSYKGSVVMIQFGGSGMEEADSEIEVHIEGSAG